MIPVGLIAGGRGSRLGTPHKCLIDLGDGSCALERLLRACRDAGAGPVVVAANDPTPFHARGLPVVPDAVPNAGPLAGIAAVLTHHQGAPAVLVLAADQPGIDAATVRTLLTAWATTGRLVVASDGAGRLHPLVAVVPMILADPVQTALRCGHYAVHRCWSAHDPWVVPVRDSILADLDLPADVERWRAGLRKFEA